MTIDDYVTLLTIVADADVDTLHAAFWCDDLDALAWIANRYGEQI